jgi:hypothetical protein
VSKRKICFPSTNSLLLAAAFWASALGLLKAWTVPMTATPSAYRIRPPARSVVEARSSRFTPAIPVTDRKSARRGAP